MRRDAHLEAISALGEPTRRALYDHIVGVGGWVGRDETADALGIERGTAAHHLDRLAADGLLDVDFQRRSGRSGPGAGRPAKLYRRAQRDFDVALPPRAYDLAGKMLAEAIDRARVEQSDVTDAVEHVANEEGQRLAHDIASRLEGARSRTARRDATLSVLADHGYEPITTTDGTVVLRNCPFHQLAQAHTELICGMNHCLLRTAIDEVGETGLQATLEPDEESCCVKLRALPARPSGR